MDRMVKPCETCWWLNESGKLTSWGEGSVSPLFTTLAPSKRWLFGISSINSISMGGCAVRRGSGAVIFGFFGDMIGFGKRWKLPSVDRNFYSFIFFKCSPLGKWSNLTSIYFQMGWFNHQLVLQYCCRWDFRCRGKLLIKAQELDS